MYDIKIEDTGNDLIISLPQNLMNDHGLHPGSELYLYATDDGNVEITAIPDVEEDVLATDQQK